MPIIWNGLTPLHSASYYIQHWISSKSTNTLRCAVACEKSMYICPCVFGTTCADHLQRLSLSLAGSFHPDPRRLFPDKGYTNEFFVAWFISIFPHVNATSAGKLLHSPRRYIVESRIHTSSSWVAEICLICIRWITSCSKTSVDILVRARDLVTAASVKFQVRFLIGRVSNDV